MSILVGKSVTTPQGGLVTLEATGPDLDVTARALRAMPGVEAAAVFGSVLRIAGMDRAALEGMSGGAFCRFLSITVRWRRTERDLFTTACRR